MKSPKQQFHENAEDVKFLADLTDRSQFIRALNYAKLQYAEDNTIVSATSPEMAEGKHWRMVGMLEFVRVLLTMADQPKPQSTRADIGNLIHK